MTSPRTIEWIENSFSDYEESLNGGRSRSLLELRKSSLERFKEGGIPTPRDEDWKYSNILPFLSDSHSLAKPIETSFEPTDEAQEILGLFPSTMVFRNGFFDAKASSLSLIAGISIRTLGEVLADKNDPDRIALSQSIERQSQRSSMQAMNAAFFGDGYFIRVSPHVTSETPLSFVFIYEHDAPRRFIAPKCMVRVGEAASVRIIETHLSINGATSFVNQCVDLEVAQSATLDYYRALLGDTGQYLSHVVASQASKSTLRSHFITFGGEFVRNEVHALIDGEGCQTVVNGLSVLNSQQHVDNATVLNHAKPHCESHELFKGIYSDRSRGVFSGTIIVEKDAQKTNAIQSNESLLLSSNAQIDTRPQLKIWADDVKCTHGATVGQLDSDALFYLRSRGLSRSESQNLLVQAFAGDVLKEIKIAPLRAYLEAQLSKKLAFTAI